MEGLALGITSYESSIAGIGGCPFAPGATGNICTEDTVHLMQQLGIETGIDLDKLSAVAREMERVLGRQLPGQVMRAGPAAAAATSSKSRQPRSAERPLPARPEAGTRSNLLPVDYSSLMLPALITSRHLPMSDFSRSPKASGDSDPQFAALAVDRLAQLGQDLVHLRVQQS